VRRRKKKRKRSRVPYDEYVDGCEGEYGCEGEVEGEGEDEEDEGGCDGDGEDEVNFELSVCVSEDKKVTVMEMERMKITSK